MTTLRHFTSLTSNVKEKIVNLPLGRKTIVLGEEGSYKTAIADAVLLALLGYHPRVGKLPAKLLKLAADPSVGISISLQGPDGFVEWDLSPGSKVKSSRFTGRLAQLTETERENILPTIPIRTLLETSKGDRKMREAVLRRFGGSGEAWDGTVATPIALSSGEKTIWTEAVEMFLKTNFESPSLDAVLSQLSEYFRKTSLAKNAEIKTAENFVSVRRSQVEKASLGAERLGEYERSLVQAEEYEEVKRLTSRNVLAQTALASIAIEIKNAENKAKTLAEERTKELDDLRLSISDLTKDIETKRLERDDLLKKTAVAETNVDVYTKRVASKESKCPYCGNQTDLEKCLTTWKERLAKRSEGLEDLTKRLSDLEGASKAQRLNLAQAENRWTMTYNEQERRHSDIRGRFAGYESEIRTIELALREIKTKTYGGLPPEDLKIRITAIRASLGAQVELEKDVAKVRLLQSQHAALKVLEKEAIAYQKTLISEAAAIASKEVSRSLLDQRTAVFDAEECEWGIIGRDGEVHPFGVMCGTEETALLLGLAAAWTRGSPLRIALFDDRDLIGLSRKGMRDFYKAVGDSVDREDFTQAIIISNRPDEAPEEGDWTKIYRGETQLNDR